MASSIEGFIEVWSECSIGFSVLAEYFLTTLSLSIKYYDLRTRGTDTDTLFSLKFDGKGEPPKIGQLLTMANNLSLTTQNIVVVYHINRDLPEGWWGILRKTM